MPGSLFQYRYRAVTRGVHFKAHTHTQQDGHTQGAKQVSYCYYYQCQERWKEGSYRCVSAPFLFRGLTTLPYSAHDRIANSYANIVVSGAAWLPANSNICITTTASLATENTATGLATEKHSYSDDELARFAKLEKNGLVYKNISGRACQLMTAHTHKHAYTCMRTHACTHTHTHAHTYIHTRTAVTRSNYGK